MFLGSVSQQMSSFLKKMVVSNETEQNRDEPRSGSLLASLAN